MAEYTPKIRKIAKYGNAVLRKKARRISKMDNRIVKILADMVVTMRKHKGIGLAAPQVGLDLRMFIVDTDNGELVFINPKILKKSWRKDTEEEGCLSVDGIWGLVRRAQSITVQADNEQGKKFVLEAKGMMARAILHEMDHINGVLFIDKLRKVTKGKVPEAK